MRELGGKVAVVTGGASGLGRGIADRFAVEGMTVVVADIRGAEAEVAAGEIRAAGGTAIGAELDVTSRTSFAALADRLDEELGGASVLVNNAGVVSHTPLHVEEEKGWRWIVEVNLFGVVHGIQTFLPRLLASGREGHIVNVASLGGIIGGGRTDGNRCVIGDDTPLPKASMHGYMATKHAVVSISEGLAAELAGSQIGVSVLCPSHHENTGIYENSAQYRPAEFGGPMAEHEVAGTAPLTSEERDAIYGRERIRRLPDECARRVVRAMRENHFYVFTHPETRGAVEHRFREILTGYDDAAAFEG